MNGPLDDFTVDRIFDGLRRGEITEDSAREGVKALIAAATLSADEALAMGKAIVPPPAAVAGLREADVDGLEYVLLDGVTVMSRDGFQTRLGEGEPIIRSRDLRDAALQAEPVPLDVALDALSKDSAVKRTSTEREQWMALGIDFAVARIRDAARLTDPKGATDERP